MSSPACARPFEWNPVKELIAERIHRLIATSILLWNPAKELKAVFVTEDQFATMVPVESGGGAESQLTAMV